MTRLGPQPLRLWVAGRPRRPLGPRARWQRPPVREAWPAEWKRSGPERACPGAGRHGPALLSLSQERGPRGHGRRLWVSGRLLRYWCAHTVLVRGRAPALAWRVTDGPRSRLVTWGGGSGPDDAGDAHLQRRSSQPVALYPLAVRTQWHSGSVLRLRAHGARTPGGKPALSLPSRRPASQQLSRQRPRCVAPLEGVPLGRGHTVPQPNPHEKQAKATVPAHAGRG